MDIPEEQGNVAMFRHLKVALGSVMGGLGKAPGGDDV